MKAQQIDIRENPVWVNVGGGIDLVFDELSHLGMGINIQYGKSISYQVGANAQIFSGNRGVFSLHPAIGKMYNLNRFVTAAYIGPSLLYTNHYQAEDESYNLRGGLMLDYQLMYVVLPELGIGIDIFGIATTDRVSLTPRLFISLSNFDF